MGLPCLLWVVHEGPRAMCSTASRGAAAASRWLRLRTALPNAAGLQNGWRCRHATGASVAVGLMYWSFYGWCAVGNDLWREGCLLVSLQIASNFVIVRSGDLHVVPIAEVLIVKPAGAAGHQNTIVVTPWQQDAVPAS